MEGQGTTVMVTMLTGGAGYSHDGESAVRQGWSTTMMVTVLSERPGYYRDISVLSGDDRILP